MPNSQVVVGKPDGGFEVLAAGADGQVLTADATQPQGVKWAPTGVIPDQGVRLTHSVNQNIGTSVDTALTFDTEKYDTASMHDGVNPTRITFPAAGKYLVVADCTWAATGGGNQRSLFIRLNGTTMLGNVKHGQTPGGLATSQCLTVVDAFNAGDYVEMVVHQDGVTLAVLGQATVPYSPWFSVQRLA